MSNRVDVDWTPVERAIPQLVDGITDGSARVARDQASSVAQAIRARLPVLTGRLISTVDVVDVADGAGVTYGGDLPYAGKIERRTGAVEAGVADGADRFAQAEMEMARREVKRL